MRDVFDGATIFGAFALAWISGVYAFIAIRYAPEGAPSPWVFIAIGVVWASVGVWLWRTRGRGEES